MLLFIEKVINLTCEKCDHAAVDHVGMIAECLSHLSGAVFGVHVDRGLHNGLIFFAQGEADVKGLVGKLARGAVDLHAAALEVEVAQGAGKALVEDRGEDVAAKLLGNHHSALRDRIERVAALVGAVCADQLAVEHLVKCLGKIEIHNIVGLHHDVIDRDEIKRIADVVH